MGILLIAFVSSTVLFGLLYANSPTMQSKEFKEIDNDEDEIWDRWP